MPRQLWQRFSDDTSGASAVEYGLLVALIVILMAAGLSTFPPALMGIFNAVSTAISGI